MLARVETAKKKKKKDKKKDIKHMKSEIYILFESVLNTMKPTAILYVNKTQKFKSDALINHSVSPSVSVI